MADHLTTDEAAAYLRLPASTLVYWRHIRKGPIPLRLGKRLFYTPEALDKWLKEQKNGSHY